MKALSALKLLVFITLFASILLVTACGGVTIKPDGDGGVTVTPNENQNGGNGNNSGNTGGGMNGGNTGNGNSNNNNHSHVYELVESDNSSSSCTEDVVRTWRCECDSEFTETFAAPGHDIRFYEGKEPTCTVDGWHAYEECDRCGYSTYSVDPALGHDVNMSTGVCGNCGDVLTPPLATPEFSYSKGSTVYWGIVDGADHYEVFISNSGNTVTTYNTYIDLEEYYGTDTELQLYIKAIAPENGSNINSANLQHIFVIPVGNITNYEGLGQSVNLLTGSYTDYANGTISIFNDVLWGRLDAKTYSIKEHDTDVLYSESIEDYTNQLTASISNKMSVSGSVGVDKIAKVTAGYSFEVGANYSKKTYNQTQAIFYDMNYVYQGYQAGIDGYNNPELLRSALSEQFLSDALALQEGRISPEEFIGKYGTHVITAGVYGATFRAHYERLMDKSDVQNTFGANIKQSISSGISAAIKGIDVGVDTESTVTADISLFTTETNSDMQSKFTINAVGGNAASNMVVTSLADFSGVCESWANSIEDENSFMLIDIPDGSLYFVWDFLGDEYAEAKDKLNSYFYASCDEQYKAINGKISSLYQDFFVFDKETGTLTIDWSARQSYDAADLSGTQYTVDGTTIFDYDKDGIFTVYAGFNGNNVKKVVFKGAYFTQDGLSQTIETKFTKLGIKFDKSWTDDIVVEFENFAYEAPDGHAALDFSEVNSENITVIITGYAYIKGGDGASSGQSGFKGIDASGKNLVIEGTGSIDILGGNGIDGHNGGEGARGGDGGNGGIGISANKVHITISNLVVIGGNGANGGNGGGNVYGYGGDGGNAGNGGNAISSSVLTINSNFLKLIGGNGANGGNGGDDTSWTGRVDGDGGKGGNGGFAVTSDAISNISASKAVLVGGNGGSGGSGQQNGEAGDFGTSAFPRAQIYIGNKCYTLYETTKTWTDAKTSTENNGAYLATITSEQEQAIINELLSYGTLNNYYIGAYRAVDDANEWAWVTGEAFSYANWGSGEPNNDSWVEDYVGIYRHHLVWNDFPLDQMHGYIEECDIVSNDADSLQ